MNVLILAGGFATRLWPLTQEKPKPLLLVNGKPLITHIVEKIPKDLDITISTNKKFETAFRKWRLSFLGERKIDLLIEPSRAEEEKFGAVKSIAHFIKEKKIKEDLLIVGGDNYFEFSIIDLLKNYQDRTLIVAYNIKSLKEAKKFGVLTVRGNKVTSFVEKPEEPHSTLINTCICILPPSIFPLLFEFVKKQRADNLGSFIAYLVKKVFVQAYITTKHWFDIGSFEGYLEAHRKAKTTTGEFWGVNFLGKNKFEGRVFIDKGSSINNVRIKDSIIASNCVVEDSTVTRSIIDEGATIIGGKIENDIIEKGLYLDYKKKTFRRHETY